MFKPMGHIILISLTLVLASGCAHQRLVDDGEELTNKGRYELAVQKYKKALELKPRDQKTRQKLEQAQYELDLWRDNLWAEADNAKDAGLHGRAMLLYSKVAQLSSHNSNINSEVISEYKALHKTLKKQARYHLQVTNPQALGNSLGQQIADVIAIQQVDPQQTNHFRLKVHATNPELQTKSNIKEVTQSYVSGYETVANPEFHNLQNSIHDTRQELDSWQGDYEHKRVEYDRSHYHLVSLEKDLDIARLRRDQARPNSNNYNYWRNEVDRLSHLVTHHRKEYNAISHQLDEINHHITAERQRLDHDLNALSYLSPTVEQEVYSDHHYQIEQLTRLALGKVKVEFSGNSASNFERKNLKRQKNITASASDDTHEEQPVLGLEFDPVNLPSDANMRKKYFDKAREQARQAITKHMKDYRQHLKQQANNQIGIDDKLEAWIHYGLSSANGVDDSTARTMRRQLEQEFGITGEFEINRLLYLFSRQ